MPTQIKTAASPSLHPAVFEFDGISEDSRAFTAGAMDAFAFTVEALGAIEDVREAAAANPALNEAARILQINAFATKKVEAAEKKIRAADELLTKQIEFTEAELAKPLAEVHSLTAQELRGIVRAMTAADRRKLVTDALASGDRQILASVLGAHPLASGLTALEHSQFTHSYNAKTQPQLASRLDVMRRTQSILRERIGLVQQNADRLIGADRQRVSFLQQADSKLAQALAK